MPVPLFTKPLSKNGNSSKCMDLRINNDKTSLYVETRHTLFRIVVSIKFMVFHFPPNRTFTWGCKSRWSRHFVPVWVSISLIFIFLFNKIEKIYFICQRFLFHGKYIVVIKVLLGPVQSPSRTSLSLWMTTLVESEVSKDSIK